MVFGCKGSSCYQNLARIYVGHEVEKLFGLTGVEVKENLNFIIDLLLTEYNEDISKGWNSPELTGRIYLESAELYNVSKLFLSNNYHSTANKPPPGDTIK